MGQRGIRLTLGLFIFWATLCGLPEARGDSPLVDQELRSRAVTVLRQALHGQDPEASTLAARHLISLDYSAEVAPLLHQQLQSSQISPARKIGT